MRRITWGLRTVSQLLILSSFLVCALADAMVVKGKNILIVSSYHPEYIWSRLVTSGIIAALTGRQYSGYISDEVLSGFQDFGGSILWMRTKYLRSEQEKERAALPIIQAIKSRRPDIVIVEDDNAARYVIPRFVNSGVQFVFCGVNGDAGDYGIISTDKKLVTNVTGILERYPFEDIFKFVKATVPERADIYVFYDDTETGKLMLEDFSNTVNSERIRVLLNSLGLTVRKQFISGIWSEWKKEILGLQGDIDL